jgi:hypothetical protein
MKSWKWYLFISSSLIGLSAITYLLQVFIFHKTEDTLFYMFQDIAFVPIQVLLVTIILSELLNRREKRIMLSKMNMAIGVFFSEVGTEMLKRIALYDPQQEAFREALLVGNRWADGDFQRFKNFLDNRKLQIDSAGRDFTELKAFLIEKRIFLLNLLENPNLLEHDAFSEMLWAIFHLAEELKERKDLLGLLPQDRAHIEGDIRRAYTLLITEWLDYVKHLRDNYPYIFSLVVRTNPFDAHASAEVK